LGSVGLHESAFDVEFYYWSSIADFAVIDRRVKELAHRRDKIYRQIDVKG
jgi:hypothetical protein